MRAVLADEVLEEIDVLVVDPRDLLGGEPAELPPLEQLARPAALAALRVLLCIAATAAAATSSAGGRHLDLLL
jgi:hypothetical protein